MAPSAVPNLTRDDARARAELLRVDSYDIVLDLTDSAGRPSERTFRSTTTVTFSATRPGESTFIDVIADRFHSVTLNGTDVDVTGYASDKGIALDNLAADNVLVVDADLLYTNTGEGLHRFVDPLDGETYLYSQFETADAKRMYACFDQPDLKAAFTSAASVPQHWQVSSNGRVAGVEEQGAAKT
ncbi:MAG: aminopeptidase N, partial [Gaiellaceae bacterium]